MNNVSYANQLYRPQKEPSYIVVQPSATNLFFMAVIGFFSVIMSYMTYRQSKSQTVQSAGSSARLGGKEHANLHDILDQYFDEQELRDICLELGVDYEDLPFSGQANKARELVALCVRCGQFRQLKSIVEKARPFLFQPARPRSQTKMPVNGRYTA